MENKLNSLGSLEKKVKTLLSSFDVKAVIFDLDGTLIDNNEYHLKTWKQFLEKEEIDISDENYNKHINGRTNKDAIEKYVKMLGDGKDIN